VFEKMVCVVQPTLKPSPDYSCHRRVHPIFMPMLLHFTTSIWKFNNTNQDILIFGGVFE